MLEKIFLQVINMSYISSIVILFILAARMLLKKAPKKYSYILWAVALFRLIVPTSFESILSLIPVNPSPISNKILYDTTPQISTGISNIDQNISGSLPAVDAVASVNPMQIWFYIGALIWVAGIVVLLICGLVSLIRMKGKLKNASCEKDNIYLSDNVNTPFVLGLIQPKIYLLDSLSEREKEYIVLHERTHIKRFDHVFRFISYLTLCVHWFNPLVWIAFWLSGKDMEMACDESVINQLGHGVKKDYSQSLLNLATGRRNLRLVPLAFGEGETKGRIKNIINFKQPKLFVIALALIIIITAFIGLTTNPKKDARDIAEQFLEIHSTPEDSDFSKYYHEAIDSQSVKQSDMNEFANLIKKEYGDLMTDEGLEKAMANRFIPWLDLIRKDTNYHINIASIELNEKTIYESGIEYYSYLMFLQVIFPDKKSEIVTISGEIVLVEENDVWKVDRFYADYSNLSKLL